MRNSVSILAAVICLTVTGCGSTDPELAEVTGVVTLDGAPLQGANLLFTNQSQAIRGSVGKTDADGQYRLVFNTQRTGCIPGRQSVAISTQDIDQDGRAILEKVPRRYRGAETELSAEIASGANVINFDLVTKGPEKKELSAEAARAERVDSR